MLLSSHSLKKDLLFPWPPFAWTQAEASAPGRADRHGRHGCQVQFTLGWWGSHVRILVPATSTKLKPQGNLLFVSDWE